jgi:hypothetical protein
LALQRTSQQRRLAGLDTIRCYPLKPESHTITVYGFVKAAQRYYHKYLLMEWKIWAETTARRNLEGYHTHNAQVINQSYVGNLTVVEQHFHAPPKPGRRPSPKRRQPNQAPTVYSVAAKLVDSVIRPIELSFWPVVSLSVIVFLIVGGIALATGSALITLLFILSPLLVFFVIYVYAFPYVYNCIKKSGFYDLRTIADRERVKAVLKFYQPPDYIMSGFVSLAIDLFVHADKRTAEKIAKFVSTPKADSKKRRRR